MKRKDGQRGPVIEVKAMHWWVIYTYQGRNNEVGGHWRHSVEWRRNGSMAAASLTERKSRRSVYYELCESGALFVCVCVRVCVRMCAWGSGEAGRESE